MTVMNRKERQETIKESVNTPKKGLQKMYSDHTTKKMVLGEVRLMQGGRERIPREKHGCKQ